MIKAFRFLLSHKDNDVLSSNDYNSSVCGKDNNSVAVINGNYGAASALGTDSIAIASGFRSQATALNKNSLAIASGKEARAKGVLNSYILLCEKDRLGMTHMILKRVDGISVKENTWYCLKNGKLKEVR